MIGQLALKLTELADDDLPLVVEFVDQLDRQRSEEPHRRLSTAEIRELAKRRAAKLADVPREQVAARFEELAEEVRQEAIDKGTAIDGDWHRD
jgi:hypothetical protein